MTMPSAYPSFLAFALMESTLGIKATYFHGSFVALNRCPFTRVHEDVPSIGAAIVSDPDGLEGDYLWCPFCGRKTQHQVFGLLSGTTLFRAFMNWDPTLTSPQSSPVDRGPIQMPPTPCIRRRLLRPPRTIP